MSLDNSELVARFAPETADGDTFIYTEMLDRGKRKGNNGVRLLKTFYHRSREEFWEQWPSIKALCDMSLVRACTRLAPRSYKKVGREFTRLVVESSLTDNWAGMKSLYNRACGIVGPNEKLWLWDVDYPDASSELFQKTLEQMLAVRVVIPSKKGCHIIGRPFDMRGLVVPANVSLHKDNPTNLYIPEGAE